MGTWNLMGTSPVSSAQLVQGSKRAINLFQLIQDFKIAMQDKVHREKYVSNPCVLYSIYSPLNSVTISSEFAN